LLGDPAVQRLFELLPEARIVGGAVRDLIADRPLTDVDFASPLPVGTVQERLRRAGIKVVPTGLSHGTVTAVLDGRGFELTTLRRDVETDGRHAIVAFDAGWREDASRRDFTINQLSMDAAARVFDYAGGIADLRAGVLRFVGEPAARIAEDYLRALRFFRFFARYARQPPEPATLAALAAAAPVLADPSGPVAPERTWQELTRILSTPDPAEAVALMALTGILAAVLPEAESTVALGRLVTQGASADPLLRLAALLPGGIGNAGIDRLAQRLRFATRERLSLDALLAADAPLVPDADDAAIRIALARAPRGTDARAWATSRSHLDQAASDGLGVPHAAWEELRARIAGIAFRDFPLTGAAVLRAGAAPGPQVGRILAELREAWIAAGAPDSRLDAELRRHVAALPPDQRTR